MKRRPIRAVVVDNYPVVRMGLRAMLRAPDIRVVGETDAISKAPSLLTARAPDILLIHIRMAEVNALSGMARIKETWPKVSLVILTTIESPSYLSRAIALGVSGYIHEKVDAPQLLKAIRAVARGECIVEPSLLPDLLKDIARKSGGLKDNNIEHLSIPELDVLRLVSEGQTNRQIAQRLGYSVATVKEYIRRIIQKLEVSDRTQAAVKAVRTGIL